MIQVILRDKTRSQTVTCPPGQTLGALLRENGFDCPMVCGGNGRCGKCRVFASGALSPMTEEERALLGSQADGRVRLACMARAEGDCTVETVQREMDVLTDGIGELPPPEAGRGDLGFAVDIGTTTVAVYGYDLKSGRQLGQDAFLNPQGTFGADVISRIEAAQAGQKEALRTVLAQRLEAAMAGLCRSWGAAPDRVTRAVLTGNTTMLTLFRGLDVRTLAAAPFSAPAPFGDSLPGAQCGLPLFAQMSVYFPRTISAFVGSDITCALAAMQRPMQQAHTALLIDAGTNGEMAACAAGRLVCCSTAAGPAFEGAGITMGLLAVPGAICAVSVQNGRLCMDCIGDKSPSGICGSGLIDAVAAFLQLGLIDETGRIAETGTEADAYLTAYEGAPSLRVGESSVVLTQKDIRAVQLAKAAVRAGTDALLHALGVQPGDVGVLLLAGGFGSRLRPESAGSIGLIPSALVACTHAVGNAAGLGASVLLLSAGAEAESVRLAQQAETVELASSAYFMDQYVERMMFEP